MTCRFDFHFKIIILHSGNSNSLKLKNKYVLSGTKLFVFSSPWWRQMETFSAPQVLCAGNHRSPVNSPYKCQWRGALVFSLIPAWTNGWVNKRFISDLRHHYAHYDVIVMLFGQVVVRFIILQSSLQWRQMIIVTLQITATRQFVQRLVPARSKEAQKLHITGRMWRKCIAGWDMYHNIERVSKSRRHHDSTNIAIRVLSIRKLGHIDGNSNCCRRCDPICEWACLY